ncbi:MAG: transposase [Culicoidibacterales bacterium]
MRGCIVKAFAKIIPNKAMTTLIPIICSQVAPNTIIHTDEHCSYSGLSAFNYTHKTVCHKYSFINRENGCNTQAVDVSISS